MSETEKYLHLTQPYCKGNGIDVGSGGSPVVPSAIQVELPWDEYVKYRSGDVHRSPIQWHGDCFNLPFKDGALDYVYSSHLIEDFDRARWTSLFLEWKRVLKPGAHMVILVPERGRWRAALTRGQIPNCSHWGPEPLVGDVSRVGHAIGMEIIQDKMTDLNPEDYSILCIMRKPL